MLNVPLLIGIAIMGIIISYYLWYTGRQKKHLHQNQPPLQVTIFNKVFPVIGIIYGFRLIMMFIISFFSFLPFEQLLTILLETIPLVVFFVFWYKHVTKSGEHMP